MGTRAGRAKWAMWHCKNAGLQAFRSRDLARWCHHHVSCIIHRRGARPLKQLFDLQNHKIDLLLLMHSAFRWNTKGSQSHKSSPIFVASCHSAPEMTSGIVLRRSYCQAALASGLHSSSTTYSPTVKQRTKYEQREAHKHDIHLRVRASIVNVLLALANFFRFSHGQKSFLCPAMCHPPQIFQGCALQIRNFLRKTRRSWSVGRWRSRHRELGGCNCFESLWDGKLECQIDIVQVSIIVLFFPACS